MIRVIYPSGIHDTVTGDYLDYLLETGKVAQFRRSSGWVVVGRDSVRGMGTDPAYSGEDRRQSQALA